ncbi:MAG: mechanosensitive ion channel family protein [Rhizobiaceae bacterium]|nr:mechanosensitive ion channel family protein [Rhizobiaceae bacterium]
MLLAVAFLANPVGATFAQNTAPAGTSSNAKIDQLLKLLDDPEVRSSLDAARSAKPAEPRASVAGGILGLDEALRNHLAAMYAALKSLPAAMGAALQVLVNGSAAGDAKPVLLLLAVLLPAIAAEWLVRRRIATRTRGTMDAALATDDFVHQLWSKLAPLLAFAVAAFIMFLAAGSSPLARKIVGVYIAALIVGRFVYAVSMALLERATHAEAPRADGTPDEATPAPDRVLSFWTRRLAIVVGYFFAATATLELLPAIGFSEDAQQLLSYIAGIGLMALAIECIWRMPRAATERFSSYSAKWLLTIYLVLLWCVWAAGANVAFWIGLYIIILPRLLSVVGTASRSFVKEQSGEGKPTPIRDALIGRGARALVILLAVAWVAFILRMNPGTLATSNDVVSSITRSLLRGVLILVAADLIWQIMKAYIDARISTDSTVAGAPSASRLRTLLPIFRNALGVLVITIACLMILSEFGVQIGPLIAGAGIFGVAIGFGSQTLVKDIVSGVFYLMDDAFRVGEYIQSGSYKGTVEGFSLRSVRLRHHRGPVFTVPFGTLGAVQNMSRDWVIDKFIVRFPFDTNIKLVKKLTKNIGAELEADPELAPIILQTVKMKGVEQIGDYGIDISFAFMTKPGYQTSVRRRAYSMMTDLFGANGIEFARPSVHVGSEDSPAAAGAASAVIAIQKAAEQAKA